MFSCSECKQTFCSPACCSWHVENAALCGPLAFPGSFTFDKAYAGGYDSRLKYMVRETCAGQHRSVILCCMTLMYACYSPG